MVAGTELPQGLCCIKLAEELRSGCTVHEDRYACPDTLLVQHKDGDIGIIIHDGGSSSIAIRYCPWCGSKLKGPTP